MKTTNTMRKYLFLLFLLPYSFFVSAQKATLSGNVVDESITPVEYATVALLHPADSTLAFFGITNNTGAFTVKNVDAGQYLMQISFVGYITYDSLLTVSATPTMNMGTFILRTQLQDLGTVEINALKNPLSIKGDTVEYNAGSYKVQPDASAEDLLRKLPGVEVDQNGNIKAQGETVQKVLVDGKEFFSDDPTVATKNLPADAIDKVQVYDKSSDEAEFTGVDDGLRTKTINLMLKEGKKSMWLGDVQAGVGTEGTYQASAKAYRFTEKNQFAGLGMFNNINQYGFSIHDYIDFNGGIGSLMRSGGFRITSDGDIPVNFGQSVDGLITSGAGGLNFTHESDDKKRINISYLANGYEKDLQQNVLTENFTPGYTYTTNDTSAQVTRNYYHRLNYNYQNKSDSTWSLFSTGGASLNYGKALGEENTSSFSDGILANTFYSLTDSRSNGWKADADLTYLRKFSNKWKYIRTTANADVKSTLTASQWNNLTSFFPDLEEIADAQFRDDKNVQLTGSGRISASYSLPKSKYLEPFISFGGVSELLQRQQGISGAEGIPTDSLSPEFQRNNIWLRPGMAVKYASKSTQWRLSLAAEGLQMMNRLDGSAYPGTAICHFIPGSQF
ncbi:MAG: TonB-dependent receptor [Chitinophagales bacterium]